MRFTVIYNRQTKLWDVIRNAGDHKIVMDSCKREIQANAVAKYLNQQHQRGVSL
jgi:hypothetical protein